MGGGISLAGAGKQSGYRYGSSVDGEDNSDPPKCNWVGTTLEMPPKAFKWESYFTGRSVVGTGMLGCVRLVQHKKTKKYYALKSMKKEDIMKKSMLRHVESEREAFIRLTKLRNPFLVKFFGSFQTSTHVHLILEYAPGGELLHRLHHVGKFSHDEAKFYATELVAFVTFCHSQGYMYRDLKPENILLDARGHVKVVDLGFVRRFSDRTERCTTSVGTPQYLAPEQLTQSQERRSYTCAVDWWALACVIFEMVVGKTPFVAGDGRESRSESPFDVYTRIVQGRIQWPRGISPSLKDLLRQMLTPDPSKRLCDADEIKQHAWFSDVDWQEVQHCDVTPPFQPPLRIEGDRSSFDEYPDVEDGDASGLGGSGKGGAAVFAHEFRHF